MKECRFINVTLRYIQTSSTTLPLFMASTVIAPKYIDHEPVSIRRLPMQNGYFRNFLCRWRIPHASRLLAVIKLIFDSTELNFRKCVKNLTFSDDISPLVTKLSDIWALFTAIRSISEEIDLKININKTKTISIRPTSYKLDKIKQEVPIWAVS